MTYPEYQTHLNIILWQKSVLSHDEWITKLWQLMQSVENSEIFFKQFDSSESGTPAEIQDFWEVYTFVKTKYDKMIAKVN
jgi:hypothetical protein